MGCPGPIATASVTTANHLKLFEFQHTHVHADHSAATTHTRPQKAAQKKMNNAKTIPKTATKNEAACCANLFCHSPIFNAFWWPRFLITPVREGWKECFRPPHAKDSRGPQGQGLLRASGWHDQYHILVQLEEGCCRQTQRNVRGNCRNKQATLWFATNVVNKHPSSFHH